MRITVDPLSFCENGITKNSANLNQKGQRQYKLKKGYWTSKILLAGERLSKKTTQLQAHEKEKSRGQNLEPQIIIPSP